MNIPERFILHASIQTNELYTKSYYDGSGSVVGNAYVAVTQVTFENVENNLAVSTPPPSPVNFKIVLPEDISSAPASEDLWKKIRDIVNTIANKQEPEQLAIASNFSDGNRIIYVAGNRIDYLQNNIFYPVPLLMLSEKAVRIKAYDAFYSFTFPALSDTASWLPILSSGIIPFTKHS